MLSRCKLLFVTLCCLMSLAAPAQNKSLTKTLISAIDSFNNHSPAEKVFLQTDRPYYSANDTIWMKAWVLDAGLNYSKQSGLLYVELIDDTGKLVISQSMPVRFGISFGQMVLDDKTIAEGRYTLRAYTNWMQNEGEQSFFTKQIYISNTIDDAWLVNSDFKLTQKQGEQNIQAVLRLTNADKKPVLLKPLQLQIKNGDKSLGKDNLQTDFDGKIAINFNLPDKVDSKHLVIIAKDMSKGNVNPKLIVPVTLNRPEKIDVQFLPESGQMVAGLPARIGFKAVGEDGNGADISGELLDNKGGVITTFKSLYKGMGSFIFTPEAGIVYSAKITSPGGSFRVYPLPLVQAKGVSLHISNLPGRDSLMVTIYASPEILNGSDAWSLIAQSGDKICYAANLAFNGNIIQGAISKNRFVSGVARFTLFNANQAPVAERLVYIDHHDALQVAINTDKPSYQPKDSIALQIKVTGNDNKAVMGSFALAVTDNGQVKADSSNMPDIRSYMLLCGDLKGTVEGPGYYFDNKNADKDEALDNLLLTQGWVGYDWKDVFNPKYQPKFKAEPEIEVSGQISRVGGKTVGGLPVMLLSTKKPTLMMDTVSDENGHFVFKNLPRIDTANFIVEVKDKKGKMFEANVNVDEFTPAKITEVNTTPLKPWYVNSDSTLLNYVKQSNAYLKESDKINYPAGTRELKEVIIKGQKTVKGSHFFAGYGASPDVVLDEADMRKANKMTIEELLIHKIKGFIAANPYPCNGFPTSLEYTIGCNPIVFFIDGFPVDEFYVPHPGFIDHHEYIKSFIGAFTAEDVRGIEEKDEKNYSIIEITTWSGNGAFMKRTHGRYLYRPMPVTWPKQFYKPKYTAKTTNLLTDLRPTVYWEPNIITDTAGKATVWFYAKGKPGTYTGILQGSDLSGNVGVGRITVKVK
jgi:hypothetical protein